ncbi:arabinofuranosyltransferase [Corynebacterium timonense]|uniref:Galactan 5-O-arabinofuranosyltransferase n=1 Tax=Corynebacterium timonense TaxID=441500 RepID=A0A1H1TUE0_9CORY|nr:arabinofuranosyltransferase [Corynebacterium timonense]SDS63925.1 galactan 5-O-arabinofuranosyltransferase [Corynebacterium timonense]
MQFSQTETAPPLRPSSGAPDALSSGTTAWRMAAAVVGAGVVSLAAWYALRATSFPAFNTSMVPRALATAGGFAVVLVTALLLWLWHREAAGARPVWRRVLTEVVAVLSPAGLVVATLGVPLSATRLYLDGIQVDQGFRTQFLSRMAAELGHHDMNYLGLPSFYPLGWFWLGGRMATLLGMPGWEVYQPWAIVSLAAGAAALVPLWRKLTGSLPLATAIAAVTTAVVLTLTPDEPYAALVALFVPAAAAMSSRALRGSWTATAALAVYLGISATFYTLFTAISAASVVVFALVLWARRWRDLTALVHLVVIGVGACLIALISWGPYLAALVFGDYEAISTANRFLPVEGTVFPLPFFAFSLVGLLSLVGLVFLLMRFRQLTYTGLFVTAIVSYLWVLASMLASLAGTSLLGFRLEVVVTLIFVTAGLLALPEIRLWAADVAAPAGEKTAARSIAATVLAIVLGTATLSLVQQIPKENERHIDQAYADTDGYGERADRFPPDPGQYYGEIVDYLGEHGYAPTETVVYTDEINFMAFNPFYGFNAFTSHYANPLGEFDLRNEALASWSAGSFEELSSPDEFLAALDGVQWRAPDAFIFRGDLSTSTPEEPWKTHIAHDIFPSEPNVRYEALFFNPEAFDSPAWDVEQIGPFVVAVRIQGDEK